MKNSDLDTFALTNFEGPLDFLLHLIQKNEIDIYEVSIQEITEQYLQKLKVLLTPNVESGAEFIGTAATLLCLKSRTLLPKHEQMIDLEEEELDPRFEIIHQLVDYCRFKEAAKELSEREQNQSGFYGRGLDQPGELKKPLGIEHLSLQDFAALFKDILAKSISQKGLIHEEEWRVSDKIKFIRDLFQQSKAHELKVIGFEILFSAERSREELIVTFLAVLELMKLGEIRIIKDLNLNKIMIESYERI